MAINPSYGYDTSLYGYGAANGDTSSPYYQPRKMPAWMQDLQARGIGDGETYTPPVVAPIDIPRGGDTTVQAQIAAPAAMQPAAAAAPMNGPDSAGIDAPGTGNPGNNGFAGFTGDVVGLGNALGNALGIGGGGYGSDPTGAGGQGGTGMGVDTSGGGQGVDTSGGGQGPDPNAQFKGGIVTANKLTGKPNNPRDNGWGELQIGEGVLTKAALAHYGADIVNKLNAKAIPKAALR